MSCPTASKICASRAPPRAARHLRLRRPRLLRRGHLQSQPRRTSQPSSCASASWSTCRSSSSPPHPWRGLDHSRRHRTHRPHRPVPRQWRDAGRARRAGFRRALLPLHDVHLLDRRRPQRGAEAVLVPGLSDARSQLQRRAARSRARRQLLGHHAHRRHARAGPAPARSEERPVHSAEAHAQEHVRGRDAARRGRSRCSPAGAAPSAISKRA